MTGRNEPCPCGSGKKYKKCCGKNVRKGGSPYEKRHPSIRISPKPSSKPVVHVQALPQMAGMAMLAMMQRRRQVKEVRDA